MNVIDKSLWTASFLSKTVRGQLYPAVDKSWSEVFWIFQIGIVRRMVTFLDESSDCLMGQHGIQTPREARGWPRVHTSGATGARPRGWDTRTWRESVHLLELKKVSKSCRHTSTDHSPFGGQDEPREIVNLVLEDTRLVLILGWREPRGHWVAWRVSRG